MPDAAQLPFNPLRFGETRLEVERRANGELVLRSGVPLAPYPRSNGEWLEHLSLIHISEPTRPY